jgi:hypothetical protein
MDDGFAVLAGSAGTAIVDAGAPAGADLIAAQISQKQTHVAALHVKEPAGMDEGDADDTVQAATGRVPIGASTFSIAAADEAAGRTKAAAIAALTPTIPKTVTKSTAAGARPARAIDAVSGWGVQIGAFSNRSTAQSRARTAALKLKKTFSGARALVMPVKRRRKTIYRARIVGLGRPDLIKACSIIGKRASGACQAVAPVSKTNTRQ